MATTPEGIMALNQPQGAAPQLSYEDSYDAMRQALQQTRPDADKEMQEMLDEVRDDLSELNDEQLQLLIDAIQQLYDNPEGYAQNLADAIKEGDIEEGDFPAEYDEEFLATVLVVLRDEQRKRMMGSSATAPMEAMLPQQFARGGIAEAARLVASKGRYGDTMLAHITPDEARLLKARGGSGTINPETGLPEFFIGKILKGIGKAVTGVVKGVVNVAKKIVSSPIGRIVATVGLGMMLGPGALGIAGLGLSAPVAAGLASGAVSALGGGSLKDVLISSAVGFLGAPGGPASSFIGKYTPQFISSSPAALAAVTGAVVGTGAGMLQGQSLKQAVQSGLTQGAIAGSMTYLSGGSKPAADNAAKTAASDAVEEVAAKTAGTLDDAAAAQGKAVSAATVPNPDGTVTLIRSDRLGREVSREILPGSTPPPTQAEAIGGGTQRMLAQAQGAPTGGASTSAVPMDTGLTRLAPIGTPPSIAASSTLDAQRLAAISGGAPQTAASLDAQKLAAISQGAPTAPPSGFAAEMASRQAPIVERGMMLPPIEERSLMGTTGIAGIPTKPPGVMDSLAQIGRGDIKEGLGNLFMPSGPTPDQVAAIEARYGVGTAASKAAIEQATPGIIRTYGPGVATGIAALGMTGGFTPKPPEETEFQQRMREPIDLSGNPSAYYIQGLPGVQYGSRGEIIGSSTWSPTATMQDVMSPTQSYINYMPMAYSSAYQPRYMNMGGIASLAGGGYPRRVGQISGPGTEKSDSIPAMLSDGEFVMTARAVRGMGNGSRREGAKRMYALMHKLEKNAARG